MEVVPYAPQAPWTCRGRHRLVSPTLHSRNRLQRLRSRFLTSACLPRTYQIFRPNHSSYLRTPRKLFPRFVSTDSRPSASAPDFSDASPIPTMSATLTATAITKPKKQPRQTRRSAQHKSSQCRNSIL
ncbi:hypothetical protein L596_006385 [Steinernema carpocapsae]|uniref:Uncharacterized protein n=1 Tax=Steinernema carpocapsae TaxID=34508 RepID=A0A4U8VA14_STECR|nr:hypothetical protein L596_006385 [Steinernema carpocapsae]